MEITPILTKNEVLNKVMAVLLDFIFSVLRKLNTLFANKSGKVLIISLHKLGDSIFASHSIKEIVKYYQPNVHLVCFKEISEVYEILFKEINLIKISKSDFYFEQRIANKKARKIVKSLEPETVIDLTGSITSASLIFSCRAKKFIGINNRLFRKLYDIFVPIRNEPHLIDIYLDVARRISNVEGRYEKLNSEQYPSNGQIVIHPFAGWPAKEWNLRKFIEVADIINNKTECLMIFPSERIEIDVLNELDVKKIKYFETKSVSDLIELIKNCSAFIGNDSGPLHLANLLGKPTFSIFGPTNPEWHLPVTGFNMYCQKIMNCSPSQKEKLCFTNGGRNGCPAFECMNNLSVQEVEIKIMEFLNDVLRSNEFSNHKQVSTGEA